MRKINYPSVHFGSGTLLCLAGLLLGGCSVLQAAKPANMTSYALDVQFESAAAEMGKVTLLVNTPNAQPGFNSPRMVYIKRAHEIDYFSQSQWVDNPARMLTPLLVQALAHSAKYRAVVQMRNSAKADIRLDTEIIRFQHEFLTLPSQVHLTIRAQLLDVHEQSVIATREFDVMEKAPEDTPYGGVIASNRAVKTILLQIADFCAQEIKSGERYNASKQ